MDNKVKIHRGEITVGKYPNNFEEIVSAKKFIVTVVITNFHYGRDDTNYSEKFAITDVLSLFRYIRKGSWSTYLNDFSAQEIGNAFENGEELRPKYGSGYGLRFEKIPLL